MTEQQEEKNKRVEPIKRILKWIGLGLLSLLIIAALVFQAPWKLITFLLIILAACTILPRPYRKYFWLSVGFVVIALIIWVFLPDDTKGWRPYTFDEELTTLEAKYAIPEEENAALIYNTLLDSYDANEFEPNLPDPNVYCLTRSEPWSSKDYPQLAEWLQGRQKTIETLLKVSEKEKCQFPIHADPVSYRFTVERLSSLKNWAMLLVRAGNNDIAEGHTNKAFKKYIAVLQMAKHLYQQPQMVDFLVGLSFESLAVNGLNRFVVTGESTKSHLNFIEENLEDIKLEWNYDFPRILDSEKLFTKNLWGTYYMINTKGKIRLSPNPMLMIRAQSPKEFPPLKYWQRKLAKAHTILNWFYLPSTPKKVGAIVDQAYEKYYSMSDPNFDWQKESRGSLMSSLISIRSMFNYSYNYSHLVERMVAISEKTYYNLHDIYLRAMAHQRGSRIIILLRHYKNSNGIWPENLEEIEKLAPAEVFVDPINGDNFVYKLTEENFTLYSRGENKIDENAELDGISDDLLIWPPL